MLLHGLNTHEAFECVPMKRSKAIT